jgi:hypothetical protein
MTSQVWKLVMLVGGVIGVVGFFLPLAVGPAGDGTITNTISGFDIALAHLDPHGRYTGVGGARVLAICAFVPALLLFAIGTTGLIRRRLPRSLGGIAMLLGVASGSLWGVMLEASLDAAVPTHLGLGAHALLVAGIAGMVAGVATIVAPGGAPAETSASEETPTKPAAAPADPSA